MMRNAFALVASLMILCAPLSAKVRLLTFHYNKPEFIEIQYQTFTKFLEDDFEIIVFNDAATSENEMAIKNMCARYDIKCIRFEPAWHVINPLNDYIKTCLKDPTNYSHIIFQGPTLAEGIYKNPSIRHCHVIQYALDNYGYRHDDIVAIVDGDFFPIRPISIRALLTHNDITGVQKLISTDNIDYLWVVFVAFDPRTLPDLDQLRFHTDVINNKLYDSGSHTYHYLKDHSNLMVEKYLGYTSTGFFHWTPAQIQSFGFNDNETWLIKSLPWPQSVEFHMDKCFLHFGASSFDVEGWDLKEEYVKKFINQVLTDLAL